MNYTHERKKQVDYRPFNHKLPDGTNAMLPVMRTYLEGRNLSFLLARENGWYASREAGDDHVRIVIPASSSIRGNIYWQARAIGAKVVPRYQSPNAPRGDALVTMWPAEKRVNTTVVVEGPMDALAAAELGNLGVALMGINPADEVLWNLRSYCGQRTIFVGDTDMLGGMTTVLQRLISIGHRGPTSIVTPYPAKDLSEAGFMERKRLLTT